MQKSKLNLFFNSNPILKYGLLFIFYYYITYFLVNSIVSFYPELLNGYLFSIGKFSEKLFYFLFLLKIEAYSLFSGTGIWYQNSLNIVIDESCSGVSLYILYIALIFTFINKYHHKFIFSILGFLFLLGINVLRIMISILVHIFLKEYYYFIHEILFVYLMYGMILYMWYKIFTKFGVKLNLNEDKK